MSLHIPPEISDAAPGTIGALLSIRWLQGPLWVRVLMVLGGAAMSYWSTPPVAVYLHADNAVGIIGFLVGLFGMALVAKTHEVLDAISAAEVVRAARDWLRKRLGL